MTIRSLVTGGAGFIGSHLCSRLIAEGHDVLCMDSLFTGRRENVRHLLGHPRFEFERHDVNERFRAEIDHVYHLACPASPIHYQRDPVHTIRTCVQGTLHALELAREVGARVFIASTSEVYGDPAVHPQRESYWGNVNPIGPRACYDEGKRCAEALAVGFARQYGVDVRIARIFNTYGSRMHELDGRVVSNFAVQALRGEPITLYGDGTQTRSFCFVDDLLEGVARLMQLDVEGGSTPVNLGNPDETTIGQLAELIRELADSSSEIVRCPLPVDDPARRRPDIERARRLLDWKPRTSLRQGLSIVVQDFCTRLDRTA